MTKCILLSFILLVSIWRNFTEYTCILLKISLSGIVFFFIDDDIEYIKSEKVYIIIRDEIIL